jgi:hypothetical protein
MDTGSDSRERLGLISLFVMLLVAFIGFIFDRVLVREGVTRMDILLTSNGLTGIAAGVLFFEYSRHERERRKAMKQQLRTIAEMNHHIRNALQVITYATAIEDNRGSVDLIRSSVDRIEWSLREVLPGHVTKLDKRPAVEKQRVF